MPAPPVFGLNSGQDHNQTIQKLLQLERIPIQRWEKQNQRMRFEMKAWDEVRNRSRALADKSRLLYSFAGPFTLKSIVSSEPGAITGSASARVQPGTQRIQVTQLASHHQIHSGKVDNEQVLPAGTFVIRVGEEKYEYKFKGGTLKDLYRVLEKDGRKHFDLFKLQVGDGRTIVGLRSKVSGTKGALHFEDPNGVLKHIGLVEPQKGKEQVDAIAIKSDALKVYERDAAGAETDSKASDSKTGDAKKDEKKETATKTVSGGDLDMRGAGAYRMDVKLEAGTTLRLKMRSVPEVKKTETANKTDNTSKTDKKVEPKKSEPVKREQTVRTGPEIRADVGPIELYGYNVDRTREVEVPAADKDNKTPEKNPEKEPEQKEPEVKRQTAYGLGVIYADKDGKEKTAEIRRVNTDKPHEEELRVDVGSLTKGRDVKGLYFFSEDPGKVLFADLKKISFGKDGKGALVPVHETKAALDAKLRINGIEITRDSNTGISDIIEGASLNLHRVTESPVTLEVKADSEEIVKRIRDWVKAYNDLVQFCRDNSQVNAPDAAALSANREPGKGLEALKDASGVFASDSTVRSLVARVNTVASLSYPGEHLRLLNDIGISTGAIGFKNFQDNRYGLLKVDEKRLLEVLSSSPEAVRFLFASDTNDDAQIDNGVAFRMYEMTSPYASLSGGLISTRIRLLKDRIADNQKRIAQKEASIKVIEERLRQKFGSMERAVGRSNATRNYLRGRLQGFQD